MVSLIFKVNNKTLDLIGNIQIESRGFVYSSEVKDIHTDIVEFSRKKYNVYKAKKQSVVDILKAVKEDLNFYVEKLIDRAPMIIT